MNSTIEVSIDYDRPIFHVMPVAGWMNDPNGPIYYNGQYHLFYQHVPHSVEWDWGLVWGHAVSDDMINWHHLPNALVPTPGWHDEDGCFSGCCVLDADGKPVILYTGARLRHNHAAHELPPPECDTNMPFLEKQLAARPRSGDGLLIEWEKLERPVLSLPPEHQNVIGWRDPFIFKRGDEDNDWIMLIGSGIKGRGGAVMRYVAPDLLGDWKFDGYVCSGDADSGAMWECPLLAKLKPRSQLLSKSRGTSPIDIAAGLGRLSLNNTTQNEHQTYHYFFCISPDAPTNPSFYWLGNIDQENNFLLDEASEKKRLDLGDTLYAPNLTEDENGDVILWGWLQERRPVGSYSYSGCLTLPRKLSIQNDMLFQEPVEQINELRGRQALSWTDIVLDPEEPTSIGDTISKSLDIEVVLQKGRSEAAGVLIRSWKIDGEGTAAIVMDWERSCLEVVFEALNPDTMEFFLDAETSRRIGGPVEWRHGEDLKLRIILDHSCLEIYTGTGEVLSTRVYRGEPIMDDDSGLDFISFGGEATLKSVNVYEMKSIWQERQNNLGKNETSQEVPFFGMPEIGLHAEESF